MANDKLSQVYASPVAEGVRFQLNGATVFAVRQESKDVALRIRREKHALGGLWARIPFLRGIARFVGSVFRFADGIFESQELEPQRIVRGSRFGRRFIALFRGHPMSLVAFFDGLAIILLLAGLALGLPMGVERLLPAGGELPRAAANAIVCAARLLGATGAVLLIPRLKIVNRLCMYRGAANKVLNVWDGSYRPVGHEAAVLAPRLTRRSDAAFVTTVLLLSIVAFALVRTFTLPVQLLVRVLLVLAVAGVVNEPIRLLERLAPEHPLSHLLAPQLLLERLYVVEPHGQMIEVAVYAFNAALENSD